MLFFFILLSSFWFSRETKTIFFWLYLWQLKEYHIGRLLDHFRTEKGKRLFLNSVVISKLILFLYALFLSFSQKLLPWQLYAVWIVILIFFYFAETVKAVWDLIKRKIKKPVLTKKTLILILTALIFEVLFVFLLFQKFQKPKLIYWFTFSLLSFDLLTPFVVSGIVLFFQPFTVYFRNQILRKAKAKRERLKDLIVVGITGSYGKTSTKEFLFSILSEKYRVLKTKEHQNSEVGISQCILGDLKPEHQIFICEMGAYNRGGIKLLCEIAKPRIGILTGINEQHLSTFGSQENIIKTKYELIESLPEDGLAIFNGENTYCRQLYQKTKIPKKITDSTFSTAVENILLADVWAEDIKVEKEFISFKVFSKNGEEVNFRVNLLGAQNVANILLAVACAKELGMSLKEISTACQKLIPLSHQMELKKSLIDGYPISIIDATYSANPAGVISHLDYLKIWSGKKVIVMPCLIELGQASQEIHRKIGRKIGEVCDLAIITARERLKEIKEGAMEKGLKKENILFLENPKEILEKIKSFAKEGNIVLLEGRIAKGIKYLFLK